ncbi:MAG: AAA family ATPase [Nanoarchaeota archaeon]|nr:AAA family ATPase [Nanoarchaeota archaeon]MBU1028223.1 AAA family ATPase [Nanoarchaeota archaeon]
MGKTIGVVSLKGGVGKTSVVSALGGAIANLGRKALLIDGNFSAPNLGLHLDIINPEKTIHDVLGGTIHMKDSIHEIGELLHLIPASVSHKSEINPFKLKDKVKSVKKNYDAIILDSSPSLNQETLAVMLASDYILVVTTPDYPTLSMTLKAISLARQRGTPIAGLVLNKVYNKNFELSLDDLEKTSEVSVMAVIPHDVNALRAVSEATPFTFYKPNSKGGKEYRKLASTLIGEKEKPVKLKRFFRWVSPNRPEINREIFYDRVFK